jgi:hypothetical protein
MWNLLYTTTSHGLNKKMILFLLQRMLSNLLFTDANGQRVLDKNNSKSFVCSSAEAHCLHKRIQKASWLKSS